MVDFDFDERELRALERAMMQVDAVVATRIRGDGCAAMARVAVRTAKSLVPEDTGALKRSIRARRTTDRYRGRKVKGAAANLFAGGAKARHAMLVEYGTVKTAAKPYLRPATTDNPSEQHRAFVKAVQASFLKNVRALGTGTASRALTRAVT